MSTRKRIEKDSLGTKEISEDVYYGIQTLRALENFPISGIKAHPEFIRSTAIVKKAAAKANMKIGALDAKIANPIIRAADEIIDGKWYDQFVVDVFQAGAGTSHNMNVNEVLANRAIEILGGKKGDYKLIHPNDHVNMSQSTNDVYPTIMRVTCLFLIQSLMLKLKNLSEALRKKAVEFDKIVKSGRTHLEDAAPIRLGQEFAAWANMIEKNISRMSKASVYLEELNIGATAVGTGLNASIEYIKNVIKTLRRLTGFNFRSPKDFIAITQSMDDFVEVSNALKTLAIDLIKIANDLRLMNSGPITGLNEINLPAVQPGSSIMPGKVNPVIAEAMNMVAFQIIGNDLSITLAAQAGQLELNVMMPVIAFNLTQSLLLLNNSIYIFTERLIKGITANEEKCKEYVERSLGIALVLNPYIGYDKASEVVQEALASRKTIREVILEKGLLSKDKLDEILDIYSMTELNKKNG